MVVRWNICKLVYLQSTWTIRQFSGTFVVNKSIAEWSKRWNDTFSHSIFENVTNKLTIECTICTRNFFFLPSFPEWLCDKRTRTHQLATNALLLGRMESGKPFLLNEFKVWNRFGRPLTMTMTTAGDNHSKMKNDSQVHIFRFQFSHVETWMMVPCRAAETKCVLCMHINGYGNWIMFSKFIHQMDGNFIACSNSLFYFILFFSSFNFLQTPYSFVVVACIALKIYLFVSIDVKRKMIVCGAHSAINHNYIFNFENIQLMLLHVLFLRIQFRKRRNCALTVCGPFHKLN